MNTFFLLTRRRTQAFLTFFPLALVIACSEDDEGQPPPTNPKPSIEISTTVDNVDIEGAIAHAASIWESHLDLELGIRINLVFVPFNTGFLGRSIPNGFRNFPNAPQNDIWYPSALAKQFAGEDLSAGTFDMDILIDGTANYYFGIDGQPADFQYDFVSLLLHEIAHGLGHGTLAGLENGNLGAFSIQPDLGPYIPSFSIPQLENLPTVYDLFMRDGSNRNLVADLPNPSSELFMIFTSDAVFFAGPQSTFANGGQAPNLYAPTNFRDGSSLSHLDETTYNNTENALMTPFLSEAEVNHNPGPITLGILQDLGWQLK